MGHKAINDGKRCAWCGHYERDEFPLVPIGGDPKFKTHIWVHSKCHESYLLGKRQQALEEDRQRRPYLYRSKA